MMRRKKTHSLSYFRGEKKHSRKKRFDPYLPLYLKAIVRSSSREVPLEGRSERERVENTQTKSTKLFPINLVLI